MIFTALLVLAGCGRGLVGRAGGPDAGIDPHSPSDLAFAAALAAFDDAERAMLAGFRLEHQGLTTDAQAQFRIALDGFANARTKFDSFATSWCSPSPSSIRCDHAAYLAGLCSYERGKILKSAAEWSDAIARLDAMQATYSTSVFIDRAAYFDGRSQFDLKKWDLARAQFARSLAASATGPLADHSQFYIGRAWFQQGLALLVPTAPAPGSPDYLAATDDIAKAEVELKKVLSTYPTTNYAMIARYFLGRCAFERPHDPAQPQVRIANLNEAIGWFDQVITAGTTHLAAAHYQRGRCRYGLAFELGTPPAVDQQQLRTGLVDFKAVPPPDEHADHALYYVAKSYVHTEPPVCTGGSDPAPASVCGAYDTLKQLAATNALFTATPFLAKTQSYVQAHYSACACNW
jgi:TolA-binding protein